MTGPAPIAQRRPSLHDVAERAGVAVSTVSRFLNGQLAIKPETEDRIHAAMQELGFSRTVRDSRAKASRASVIGLVVPQIGNTYFGRIAESVVAAADTHGFSVLMASTLSNTRKQGEYVDLLADKDVAGIVYLGNTTSNRALSTLIKSGLPVVVLDEALIGTPPVDTVIVDDYAGAYQAT